MLKKIYNSKWFPRLFYVKPDGGKDSGVTAYFLIEWKVLFSIGFLHFKKGSKRVYYNREFGALSWWLKGEVTEKKIDNTYRKYKPSLKPKYTSRNDFHKIFAHTTAWCFTLRGPWNNLWF